MKKKVFISDDIVIKLKECKNTFVLNNSKKTEIIIKKISKEIGTKIVFMQSHLFFPQGITSVAILASSHLVIHTWPEYNFVLINISSCRKIKEVSELIRKLKKIFLAKNVNFSKTKIQL